MTKKIWVDKYEPESLDEVVGHDNTIMALEKMLDKGVYDHLLLAGPPGTGKTTILKLLAKEILGDTFNDNFWMCNSSDDRGIETVRDDISDKASRTPIGSDYKIIFMDEIDGMTKPAQDALRGTIEEYQDTCLFFATANYPNKVRKAICGSRNSLKRVGPVDRESMRGRLLHILDSEGMSLPDDVLDAVLDFGEERNGDMRAAIKMLQITAIGYEAGIDVDELKDEIRYFTVSDLPVRNMVNFAIDGNFTNVDNLVRDLISSGVTHSEIFNAITTAVIEDDRISNRVKSEVLEACANGDGLCSSGSRPRIQINNALMKLAVGGKKNRKKKDVFAEGDRFDKSKVKKSIKSIGGSINDDTDDADDADDTDGSDGGDDNNGGSDDGNNGNNGSKKRTLSKLSM